MEYMGKLVEFKYSRMEYTCRKVLTVCQNDHLTFGKKYIMLYNLVKISACKQ